jgi:hypothetical protein
MAFCAFDISSGSAGIRRIEGGRRVEGCCNCTDAECRAWKRVNVECSGNDGRDTGMVG